MGREAGRREFFPPSLRTDAEQGELTLTDARAPRRRPPDIDNACAVYRAKLREHVKIMQGMAAERFRLGIGGGIPKEKAAQALREWLFDEAEDVDASLTTGVFDVVLQRAKGMFHEDDLRDHKFVTALALTHKRFYDALLTNASALYLPVEEVPRQGGLLAGKMPEKTAGTRDSAAPLVPTLSRFTQDHVEGRLSVGDISDERADQIRTSVRDLIQVVGDKLVTDYSAQDAEAFKRVLLALPANWNKMRGLRELNIVKASAKTPEQRLKPQSVGNIKKKWRAVHGVFELAAVSYAVKNRFVPEALGLRDKGSAEGRLIRSSRRSLGRCGPPIFKGTFTLCLTRRIASRGVRAWRPRRPPSR